MFSVNGIDDIEAGPYAHFFAFSKLPLAGGALFPHFVYGCHHAFFVFGSNYELFNEWVFGGKAHEGDAEERIGAGGKYGQLVA